MKSWIKPEAIGQEFVANDYVSACSTVEVKCDFHASIPGWGYGVVVPSGVELEGSVYTPCDHPFVIGADSLHQCVFTETSIGPDDAPLAEAQSAYYWIETKEDGSKDFHATSVSSAEAAMANKS